MIKKALFPYKFLVLLIMLYITADLASNVVVYDMIRVGNYVGTAAMLIFPATYLVGDVLTEVYGYNLTRQVIWYDLICNLLFSFSIVAAIHLPAQNIALGKAYELTLGHLGYIGLGALFGGVISEFINAYMLSKLKLLSRGRYFWLRSVASSAIGMALLLLIANAIAFVGLTSFYDYLSVSLTTYLFELVFVSIMAVPISFLVYWLKRSEGVDADDRGVNFNPFQFT